jgi:tetratricopeptide (TPR) repeat protein
MAEGMLGGILGGEEEKPEVEAPEALAGAEAFAAAVAAKLSGNDPGVARKTEEFLSEQTQLLKVQKEHLKDEHSLRVAHLRNQLREENVRRFGLRLRTGFQLFIVLVAIVIGIGFAVMIRDAVTSRSVVIDSFDISPNLATQNFTGRIVAAGLVDRLRQIQSATRTSIQKRDISDAWSNEINIEVPETGLSIGAIERLLKTRFGHDQHISGDLVKMDQTGLALTVRGSGVMPKTFSDAKGDLDALTNKAAEYVYAQSQPALWANYLVDSGRFQEAIEFCQASIGSSSKSDRPVLLTNLAGAIVKTSGPAPPALELLQRAIALDPNHWDAYNSLSGVMQGLGHEEDAWRVGEHMRKAAGGRPGRAPEMAYSDVDFISWNLPAQLAEFSSDAEASSGAGTLSFTAGPAIALIDAEMHDPAAAEFALQTTKPDPTDPSIAALTHAVRGMLAAESGDAAKSLSEWEAYLPAYSDPAVAWAGYGLNCWAAPAEEAAGHPDKADAVLKEGGTFVDCYRFRGDILDGRGDWPGAQKAYAEAVALAPDLPAAYYSWGVALAKHGDLNGAVAKLKDSNQRQPHWADPLKAWGDVLVKQGKSKEALAKYDEALKYAPNWKDLKEVRDATAKQKS